MIRQSSVLPFKYLSQKISDNWSSSPLLKKINMFISSKMHFFSTEQFFRHFCGLRWLKIKQNSLWKKIIFNVLSYFDRLVHKQTKMVKEPAGNWCNNSSHIKCFNHHVSVTDHIHLWALFDNTFKTLLTLIVKLLGLEVNFTLTCNGENYVHSWIIPCPSLDYTTSTHG